MTKNNDDKISTSMLTKILIGALITMLLGAGGFTINNVYANIEKKVDKTEFEYIKEDVIEIKTDIKAQTVILNDIRVELKK